MESDRHQASRGRAQRRTAVSEAPCWLEVNGARVAAWSCSPDHGLEALAAGRLIADGYLVDRSDLLGIEVARDDVGVIGMRARVRSAAAARGNAEREHSATMGCGLLHLVRCGEPARVRSASARRSRRLQLPDGTARERMFRALFAAAERDGEMGGVHCAGLWDGRRLEPVWIEASRHNAVDKVLGDALLAGASPAGRGLVLTARISGEIAQKAVRAGVAWVASRSIPTTLALEIAGACGLHLIARAAGSEARVHAPPAPARSLAPLEP